MKDDKEHIDQLFESLNDRQFDIPEAFLEDLNKRLDNEPKKKYFFLWFLGSFALIAAIGIGYFQNVDKSGVDSPVNQTKLIAKEEYKEEPKTQNGVLINEQSRNNSNPVNSLSTPLTDKGLSTTKQIQLEKASEKGTNQTSSSDRVELSQRISKTKNDQTTQLSLSKKLKTENKNSPASIRTEKQTKKLKSKGKGTLLEPANLNAPTPKTKGKHVLNSGGNEKIQDKASDKIAPNSIPDKADIASATEKKENQELSKESVQEKETDSTIAQNTADTTQQANSSQPEKDKTDPKAPADKTKWKKEVVLFGGLGANMMQDSPKNSAYLAKIKENQTSILAPSFGVNANLSYKKFTFGTGINYEQTGEKFKVDLNTTEAKDSTYSQLIQDTIWVQDTSGVWIPTLHDTTMYYTVQYMDTTWMSRSFQNRYSWISIPIHFGYRFELGKYELIPRIGAVFNFGIAQGKGTYPNAAFNDVYRYPPAKFTVSYLIQFEARRNFDKWFVFINPYFRSMINPSVSGDVIRRRYSSWGIQFGIGFNL